MDVNAMLDEVEVNAQDVQVDGDVINIDVRNSETGLKIPIKVYPDNTLGQIHEGYKGDLGIKVDSVIFHNDRTGKSTPDMNATVTEFDLRENDVLSIVADGRVA